MLGRMAFHLDLILTWGQHKDLQAVKCDYSSQGVWDVHSVGLGGAEG